MSPLPTPDPFAIIESPTILTPEEVEGCRKVWKELAYMAKAALDTADNTGHVQRSSSCLAFWAGLSEQPLAHVHETMTWFTLKMRELGSDAVHDRLEAIYLAASKRAEQQALTELATAIKDLASKQEVDASVDSADTKKP